MDVGNDGKQTIFMGPRKNWFASPPYPHGPTHFFLVKKRGNKTCQNVLRRVSEQAPDFDGWPNSGQRSERIMIPT